MKVAEIMDLVYLVNQFKKYLKEDLDKGDDSYDVIMTNEFMEIIQSKITRIDSK